MQATTIEIEVPIEAFKTLRGEMSDEERKELHATRGVHHSAEAEKILREALVPYFAAREGLDPDKAEYTLGGEIVETEGQSRDDEGNFV